MLEQRKISLKDAPLIFNLWDNVYHQNAVRNLESTGKWDPSKLAKEQLNLKKKKEHKFVESSDEEEGVSGGETSGVSGQSGERYGLCVYS